MVKIPSKIKEQVYEHLRTTKGSGDDLTATIKSIGSTFKISIKQASGLVGVASKKGWLTKTAPAEKTIKKDGEDASTIIKPPATLNPADPDGMSVGDAVKQPAPADKVKVSPGDGDPAASSVQQLAGLVDEMKTIVHERPGAKASIQPRKELNALMLEAFQMLETGSQMVDVMLELDLTFEEAKTVLDNYNALKHAEAERSTMDERYLLAWHTIAQVIGESVRDSCERYQDESGVCTLWDPKDVESQFRKKYPGMFTTAGKRLRIRVLDHPEVCAICHKGA